MTPESVSITDRTHVVSYSASGINNAPLCLKWMLVFEEPETRTLWLGKAVPRDWLAAGETPVSVQGATTRYGRVSFTMQATATAAASATTPHTVRVNVSVPSSWGGSAARKPAGGLCVRVRAPREHAGKMSGVTVGGQPWAGFDAGTETVTFSAVQLAGGGVAEGLQDMVVSFGAATAMPLRRAKVDMSKRLLAKPDPAFANALSSHEQHDVGRDRPPIVPPPACPSAMTAVDTFDVNGTSWVACEDLQIPGGALVLVSSGGDAEWFTKGYAPYGTNWTDGEHYLGLGKAAVASAGFDLLGDTLLCANSTTPCEPTWAEVAKAVPPIRVSGKGQNTWDTTGHVWTTDCTGIRTFVGSRDAAIDFTFNDQAQDCGWNGSPSVGSYAQAMHLDAVNEPQQKWNESGMAGGLVGNVLPTALFYFPVSQVSVTNCSKYAAEERYCNVSTRSPNCNFCGDCKRTKNNSNPCPQCAACTACQLKLKPFCAMDQAFGVNNNDSTKCRRCVQRLVNNTSYGKEHRYWTYMNIPKPDMGTSREQGTWMRFQQVACAGPGMLPPCRLHDWPMYWDTMWPVTPGHRCILSFFSAITVSY